MGFIRIHPFGGYRGPPGDPPGFSPLDNLEDLALHVAHLFLPGLLHQFHRQRDVVHVVPGVFLHVVADLPDLLPVVLDVIVPFLPRGARGVVEAVLPPCRVLPGQVLVPLLPPLALGDARHRDPVVRLDALDLRRLPNQDVPGVDRALGHPSHFHFFVPGSPARPRRLLLDLSLHPRSPPLGLLFLALPDLDVLPPVLLEQLAQLLRVLLTHGLVLELVQPPFLHVGLHLVPLLRGLFSFFFFFRFPFHSFLQPHLGILDPDVRAQLLLDPLAARLRMGLQVQPPENR